MRNKNDHSALNPSPAKVEASIRLAIFDQYRSLLFSIAYRMLGSVADAEDMLQEAYIRWQQAKDREIRSPRAFLVTIISRLCINHLESARVKREEYVGQWLPEPVMTGAENDPLAMIRVDESLSMAFLVVLERLTPIERAVFLLREVFEYECSEIANVINQTESNCRQILHRARQHVSAMRPRFKTDSRQQKTLLEQFLQAATNGDLEGLEALLSKDVVLHSDGGGKAVAVPNRIHGSGKVARGVIGALKKLIPKEVVRRMAQINGTPGLVSHLNGKPFSVLTLDVSNGRITAIYLVTNPEKLNRIPDLAETPH
jgi:RNA polymerase sigma-70 factor (ECF subfamily)